MCNRLSKNVRDEEEDVEGSTIFDDGQNSQQANSIENVIALWTEHQRQHAAAAFFEDDPESESPELAFAVRRESREEVSAREASTSIVQQVQTDEIHIEDQPSVVGGLDISYNASGTLGVCVLALLSYPHMKLLHSVSEICSFSATPYVASYLGAREAHPLANLVERVRGTRYEPDLLFIDGNGRLHPRQAGSAVSIGVLTGKPSIGVAKEYHPIEQPRPTNETSFADSQHSMKLACRMHLRKRGDWIPISAFERRLRVAGALLTSPAKGSTRPVFVSVGNRLSLDSAIALTLLCSSVARVPEPIRQADRLGRELVTNL